MMARQCRRSPEFVKGCCSEGSAAPCDKLGMTKLALAVMICLGLSVLWPAAAADPGSVRIIAGGVAEPLTSEPGDAVRGRSIVTDRRKGLCLLCHSGPFAEERFQGDLAPSLAGAGSRNDAAQLRARMVDSRQIAPGSLMPPYFSMSGLNLVAPSYAGKTILSAQEIEDVVAFLLTLKEPS